METLTTLGLVRNESLWNLNIWKYVVYKWIPQSLFNADVLSNGDAPEPEPLDLVWAKSRGYPSYPALVREGALHSYYVNATLWFNYFGLCIPVILEKSFLGLKIIPAFHNNGTSVLVYIINAHSWSDYELFLSPGIIKLFISQSPLT